MAIDSVLENIIYAKMCILISSETRALVVWMDRFVLFQCDGILRVLFRCQAFVWHLFSVYIISLLLSMCNQIWAECVACDVPLSCRVNNYTIPNRCNVCDCVRSNFKVLCIVIMWCGFALIIVYYEWMYCAGDCCHTHGPVSCEFTLCTSSLCVWFSVYRIVFQLTFYTGRSKENQAPKINTRKLSSNT